MLGLIYFLKNNYYLTLNIPGRWKPIKYRGSPAKIKRYLKGWLRWYNIAENKQFENQFIITLKEKTDVYI